MRGLIFHAAFIILSCTTVLADSNQTKEKAAQDPASLTLSIGTSHENDQDHRLEIPVRLGANMDLVGSSRDFGASEDRQELALREVELSIEAEVTPWLSGFIFMSRPEGEPFSIEEAAVLANLPWNIRLKAGQYRDEFGFLNTIHEPERPQASLPLPIVEFLGDEQLREPAVTIGRIFDLSHNKRTGLSLSILNSENDVAFNEAASRDKAYSGKLYYGSQSDFLAYQLGASALTGKNDLEGELTTSTQALDFRIMVDPLYNKTFDYPARLALMGEWLFNQRELGPSDTNRAVGYWSILDYQFLPSHHLGIAIEYSEGLEDQSLKSKARSAHYSWYYNKHSRMQLQGRYVDIEAGDRGLEVLLQWNIVLGPHSERPFLAILPMDKEL